MKFKLPRGRRLLPGSSNSRDVYGDRTTSHNSDPRTHKVGPRRQILDAASEFCEREFYRKDLQRAVAVCRRHQLVTDTVLRSAGFNPGSDREGTRAQMPGREALKRRAKAEAAHQRRVRKGLARVR